TCASFYLHESDWVVGFSASADFFGLATLDAHGWFNSSGWFDLKFHGELVLGSRSFGVVGDFTFHVWLREVDKVGFPGQKEYSFGVSFSASVDARLFGISFGGIGVDGSITARGEGTVDLIASVRVSFKILFVRIHVTVDFKI